MAETVTIASLGHSGDGIAETPQGRVFVPLTLPGETVKIDDRAVGAIKASDLAVDVTAKAIRTKPFLDLLAFAVAHEDQDRVKADQAELKALLLAALPLLLRRRRHS